MGQFQSSLYTEVEIEAGPERVRDVFMDFPRYKEWCKWTVEPIGESSKKASTTAELGTDDHVKVDMKGTVFRPVILESTPDSFTWEGSLYGLLVGKHQFLWKPSEKTTGGTTVVQTEDFRGPLAFMFGEGWSPRRMTLENWDEFFADLKREAEK